MVDDQERLKTVEHEFATTTTLHGVQYIATSKEIFVKFLWLLVFLGGLAVCLWQITLRIQEYKEFDINTDIQLTFKSHLAFPAVTICNFNRYRNSSITEDEREIIEYLWEAEDYDYFSDSEPADYDTIFGTEPFNTSEFTRRVGFQLDSQTVIDCKWQNQPCSGRNFTHIFTSYGNCYMFNSGQENGYNLLEVKQAGSGNGLQMMINIQQDEYTETRNGYIEAGLKVLIHDQDEPPLMESKGISIPPGYHAFTSTRRVNVKNLDPPYGKCDKTRTLIYYDEYTFSGCYIECRLERIVKECGCRPIRYPGDAEECTPKVTAGCAKDVLERVKSGAFPPCDCPVPCEYTSFQTSVNYALIPSKSVEEELTKSYNVSAYYIRDNFILLDVYYEELNFQEYTQNPAMTFSALLSDIGGQLGLFIGGSVITFAEIGQYLVWKIRSLLQNNNSCRKNRLQPLSGKQQGIDNKGLELR